jgi:hypothetical protein
MKAILNLVFFFFACLYSQTEFFGRTLPSKGNQYFCLKFLPGVFIGDYSGSQGSTTFSHNKGGQYMKNKSIPTNQQNPAQIAVRSGLISISSSWRALASIDRTAWDSFAASIPKSGPFGLPKFLTGHQTFISCNQNLIKVSSTQLLTPGSIPTITSESSVNVNAAGGAATMTITFPTAIQATERIYVRMSAPKSAGIKTGKGLSKFICYLDNTLLSPFNIKIYYELIYGAAWQTSVGSKIFCEISVVDELSGLTTMATLGGDVIAA